MKISATEEYGLRCLLQVAKLGPNAQVSASSIAAAEGISVQYASKLMQLFRRANLVESVRGLHGGFRLVREAEKISLQDVFQALTTNAESGSFCERFRGDRETCVHYGDCSVRPVWQVLFEHVNSVLKELSLGDLVAGEAKTRMRVAEVAAIPVMSSEDRIQ